MLRAKGENTKERCTKAYTEENRKVKGYIYQSKKEVNEKFGRNMNQDGNGNRKLFGKR